jgi:hypothetical protein
MNKKELQIDLSRASAGDIYNFSIDFVFAENQVMNMNDKY